MDPLKPPIPNNRNRYVPIPLHPHHHPDRPFPHPHPHPDRPFPHPHHHPYISPPSSPYHPSRHPHESHFQPDPRRPLPAPILNHPHDRIPADHLIPPPFREDRARLPDPALSSPGFVWDDAPRPLRRRPPPPIGWENPGPHSSDPRHHHHHHRGLHPPFLETTNSAPVRRKRYDPDPEILEFTHDDRCCVDVPQDRREHHHQHHEHRHIRRRSNPPFEPFLPNSLPSTSVAVVPDRRSIEWATRNRNPFDAPEALENSSVERAERIKYPFDAPGPPDRGSPERAAGSRYLIDGLKPHDHSPVKKAVRIRHYLDGPKPPDHSSVERAARIRHPPDGPRPSDQSYLDRGARIRYPFDAPEPPNRSPVERETWIRYPFDGPKPPDRSFVEGAQRGRYPFDAPKPLQQRSERGDPVDEDRIWIQSPALEINKEAVKRDNDALRIIPGKRLPLHSRLGNVNNMEAHEKKSQKTSVLLRIQPASKPIRKRKDEPLLSSYVIGSSTSDPKGKAPSSFSEHVLEKDSSVELDVSFKSNALVAKPILLAPTKTVFKSKKTVLVKKKKKIVKRVPRLPNSHVAGKIPGSTSASLGKDLQRLEVLEEGKQSSRATGNNVAEVASSSPHKDLQQIEILEAGKVSSVGASGEAGLDLCPPGVVVLLEDSSVEGSPEDAALLEDQKGHVIHKDNDMNFVRPDGCYTSLGKELVILDSRSPSPSGLGRELQDAIPAETVMDGHEYSLEDRVAERDEERKNQMEVGVLEESGMTGSRNCKDTKELLSPAVEELGILSLEVQTLVFNQRSPDGAIEGDGSDEMVEVGLHHSDSMRPAEEVLAVTATKANEEGVIHSPDRLSTINSPESFSVVPETDILNAEQSWSRPSVENLCIDDKNKPDEKSASEGCLPLKAHDSMVSEPEVGAELYQRMQINDHMIQGKVLQLPLQGTKKPTADPKLTANESGKRIHQSSGIPRSFRHPAGFASGSLKETSSSHIVRPRTWHRTDNSSASPSPVRESGLSHIPLRRPSPKKIGKIQSMSYIRKGNSLVRNSAPVIAFSRASPGSSASVYTSNPTSGDKMNNCVGSERKIESSNYSKTGVNPSIVRPKTPPLPNTTKLPNCTVKHPRDSQYSIIADPSQAVSEPSMFETSDPIKPTKGNDTPWSAKGSEKQAVNLLLDGLETQSALYVGKLKSPKTKRMIYVKRKSNQLVAAPRPEIQDSSVPITEKTQALPFSTSSDFYYKRKNNQLVRNNVSLESQFKQAVAVPDDNSNSEGKRAPKISSLRCNRGISKRRFDKVLEKTNKTSKLSLVWTLGGTQSHAKDMTSLQRRKVLPYLVPWKRTAYWRCFINNIASVSNKSSLSLIRKLQLSRKRDTVYTRSSSGFSLRKSKVLSIGGSHLKWSKSIERHSKKANEEATLAVAAVEREKREHKGAGHIIRNAKNRSRSSRERIFCIGSVRYKMDQSNRTLLRIPDEKPSCSINIKSGKDSRISFVPRRLLIGNEEYIRIGNGNQLVRDPKRLTRILASEKIRWSLHTARLRLAKKKQYCQFFTRFGKCNKDGGNCPYIHDPAKVAVCTKFLLGLCSDGDCKLTHKVIPERMQDCSYFLQGLCTNESCPYRHVNVNPNASVCNGFLRGYCADGNECRKKHSYVCPMFKENGICPQGSTCKLHHPKTKNKSKKRKRLKNQKNARGRYFGSPLLVDIGQSGKLASDSCCAGQGGDIFSLDGRYADFISLDVGDEEARETNNTVGANTTLYGCDSSDLQLDSLDPLIKPVLLMNENAS
ncbi:uncharacterized protein LOC131236574 isoform X2 [Magnolia sinica]|uniref:uncharacterized protein LOC131236574 isoform X2 n=1 Tax=Magnolia sinica TaxID=86752 RepID=UPI002657B0D0|nr:uncharacterized protein LOC131236574 isoform X2 [Magnolia sinica]